MTRLKIKDLFTIGTILAGFSAAAAASHGLLEQAAMLIALGLVLDAMDGLYGRWTGTSNAFGKQFDLLADLVVYSMAVSFVIYFTFDQLYPVWALMLGSLPLIAGCIRLAAFQVKSIEYPGFWLGLPRPAAALAIVGLLNSSVFLSLGGDGAWGVAAASFVVIITCALNLTLIPYPSHHKRHFTGVQKSLLGVGVTMLVIGLLTGFFWDALLAVFLVYILSPLFLVPAEERKRIRLFVRKWTRETWEG